MADLAAAYELCREINARHGKSFYRATSLLPRSRRSHVWALYAVARRSDDIVDHPEFGLDPSVPLRQWEIQVLNAVRGDVAPVDPVLCALQHTVQSFGIPTRLFEEFFGSMRSDLTTTRYETWPQLRDYMRGSAAAIGEMTAPVLGATTAGLPYAAALGEAFQLTNFIRDIAEDWQRRRIYLPIEDFRVCDLTPNDLGNSIATGISSPQLRTLVKLEITRARGLYAAAAPGIAQVDRSVRPCLRVALALYGEILTEVERGGYEICQGRVVVPPRRRAFVISRALADPRAAHTTTARTRW